MVYKRVIEIYIVRHKNFVFQQVVNGFGNIFKHRRILHHAVIYAGKGSNINWNTLLWIYQAFKMFGNAFTVVNIHGNFSNAIGSSMPSGGFYIYYCVHGRKDNNTKLLSN